MTLATAAVAETYHDVKPLLHQIVWRFRQRYGGDPDELFAEANKCFLAGYGDYNPACAPCFSTWLTQKVWWGLLDLLRKEAKQRARFPMVPQGRTEYALEHTANKHRFDVEHFASELSEDARLVVQLVVVPPPDIAIGVRRFKNHKSGRWFRKELMDYLQDIGWAAGRIAEAFAEITSALD